MATIDIYNSKKGKRITQLNNDLKKAETTEELYQRIHLYLKESRKNEKTNTSKFLKRLNLIKLAVLKK